MADALPRVFGPYFLLARLGQGAAGAAYLARPIDPRRGVPSPVVIKCLHAQLTKEDEYVRRFRHEAEIAVLVDGDHVAKTYDVGAVGSELYIALEYIPGWTFGKILATAIDRKTPPPIDVACGLAVQAARGLHAIHTATDERDAALEAVHRDVAPKNVMLGDDGLVRIIDLGLGKSKAQDWKTGTGRVMGSPGYMSSEQMRGLAVDRRADIYAVGVLLHELLTGQRYIPVTSSVSMLVAALEKVFVAPSLLRADVPSALDDVLRSAMKADPAKRTKSAAEFVHAIEAALPVADAQRLREWAAALLPDEQGHRVREVERLLSLAAPMPDAGPEVEKTVVYVRRSGVGSVRPPPEKGSFDRLPPASMLEDTKVLPDQTRPLQTSQPSRPADMASLTAPMFTVRHTSRWPRLLVVLAALGIGFAGGAWLTGGRAEVAVRAPAPAAPRVAPTPSPVGVTARPVEVEAAVPPPSVSEENTPRRRTRRRVEAEPVVVTPPPSPRVRQTDRMRRLEARVLALGQDSPQGGAANKLLARLAMVRSVKDQARVERQLDQIEATLEQLEAH